MGYDTEYSLNICKIQASDGGHIITERIPETIKRNIEKEIELWVEYFYSGQYQYCGAYISYDDFDLSKLASKRMSGTQYTYQSL